MYQKILRLKTHLSDFFVEKLFRQYKLLFSIKEIEDSRILQWFFGAMLLVFFATFSSWIHSGIATVEAVKRGIHLCWPYFQGCGDWYFLQALPHGYSQNILYMFFFGIMLCIVFLMWKRNWALAHLLMAVLFLWEFFLVFVLSPAVSNNFDYYLIFLTFIILFLPFKLFFLKLTFVVFYFLAATIKIRGWITGSYFTTLQTGLPILVYSNGKKQ